MELLWRALYPVSVWLQGRALVFYVADGGGTAGSSDEYIRGVENGGGVQWTHGHSQSTGVAAA